MQKVLCIVRYMYKVGDQKKGRTFLFAAIILLLAVLMVTFAFAGILTDFHIFGWLLYGTIGMGIVVGLAGNIWILRDALQHIKKDENNSALRHE